MKVKLLVRSTRVPLESGSEATVDFELVLPPEGADNPVWLPSTIARFNNETVEILDAVLWGDETEEILDEVLRGTPPTKESADLGGKA